MKENKRIGVLVEGTLPDGEVKPVVYNLLRIAREKVGEAEAGGSWDSRVAVGAGIGEDTDARTIAREHRGEVLVISLSDGTFDAARHVTVGKESKIVERVAIDQDGGGFPNFRYYDARGNIKGRHLVNTETAQTEVVKFLNDLPK